MASTLLGVLRGGPSEDQLRFHQRLEREAIAQAERPDTPHGRYGIVTAEDLAATQHRIRTGLPALPCAGWRW